MLTALFGRQDKVKGKKTIHINFFMPHFPDCMWPLTVIQLQREKLRLLQLIASMVCSEYMASKDSKAWDAVNINIHGIKNLSKIWFKHS